MILGMEQVLVRMPPEMHAALKARAEAEDRSAASVARQAIGHYLGMLDRVDEHLVGAAAPPELRRPLVPAKEPRPGRGGTMPPAILNPGAAGDRPRSFGATEVKPRFRDAKAGRL